MSDLASVTASLRPNESILTLLVAHHPRKVQRLIASLSDLEALVLSYSWDYLRRPAQVPPPDPWDTWVILAGRGFGKTRPGAEQVIEWARTLGPDYGFGHIALIGKDPYDVRTVMIEGESGILRCSPPYFRPRWEPTKRELTWDNGVVAHTYSAEVPDDLRGPQFHKGWGDELPKWKYPQETWDMYQFGLRLGRAPQTILTNTPRPIKVLKEILSDPGTRITRGRTSDNYANLSPAFLRQIYRKYKGTRLGRQELDAELLSETKGALWTLDMIEDTRVREAPCPMVRLAVAIDPGVTDPDELEDEDDDVAETGIVVVGQGENDHTYVLHDISDHLSAAQWGKRAVSHYAAAKADEIVGESNNGGDLVEFVIKTAAEELGLPYVYRKVWASRGKRTRAEPVSARYEQRRQHHVGAFPELEDQMTTWVPGMKSPDRLDAMVWGTTAVALDEMEEPQKTAVW
jgi:phage terminase large subunit-like protein